MVKTEQATDSSHQPQLYRLSPSPGPSLPFDTNLAANFAQRDSHQHSQGDDCSMHYSPSSSSSSSLGYSQSRQTASVLSISNNDLYYHQPYIRSDSSSSEPSCSCLTNPAAGNPLISLTHQLQSTIDLLRQLPEHATRHNCTILKRITQLSDLMQYVSFFPRVLPPTNASSDI